MPLYAFVVPKKKTMMYDPQISCPLVNCTEYAHKSVPIPTLSMPTFPHKSAIYPPRFL